MRFVTHGAVRPEAGAALAKKEHAFHTVAELSDDSDLLDSAGQDPAVLLGLLDKKQWNLLTTDRDLVNTVYEKKVAFAGSIVLILEDPEEKTDQADAIERLFERYRRLTPRRLYTVTRNRVKIRQLPGGGS
jgi:hypothetical protein